MLQPSAGERCRRAAVAPAASAATGLDVCSLLGGRHESAGSVVVVGDRLRVEADLGLRVDWRSDGLPQGVTAQAHRPERADHTGAAQQMPT